ncbi:MAG: mercuric reductase [Acidobacteriaceae bacterium]|nr:mercuric reductase [Acidobacteriaceae bacterium]
MPAEKFQYDAIVIGSGQGGNPLAQAIAARGEKVALIESDKLGGTCINTGCTPTKTMVASAQIAHYARQGARWGVHASNVRVDLPAVLKRKDEVVTRFRSSWDNRVNNAGQPELIRGRARFTGPKQLEVGDRVVNGRRIFLDTGSAPRVPLLDGLEKVPFLTNVSMLEVREIPEHLIVMGGGYIGLEFGQMFRRFGSEVTVLQSAERILPQEDEDVTSELRKCLEGEGMRFHLRANATKVEGEARDIRVTTETQNGKETVVGSHLLVATGRTPQTADLDLASAGIKTNEKGYVVVNERLETSAPDVWAIGDVTGGPAFTHISYNDYQIIYGNLYEGRHVSTEARLVPYAVFTDPALGRVGMTEIQARRSGHKIKVGKIPMTYVARAIERDETAGLMKLVVDAETDLILGAAMLSSEGGELVQILSTLMLAAKPYTLLKGAIYIHPTLAEGFFALMDSVKEAN